MWFGINMISFSLLAVVVVLRLILLHFSMVSTVTAQLGAYYYDNYYYSSPSWSPKIPTRPTVPSPSLVPDHADKGYGMPYVNPSKDPSDPTMNVQLEVNGVTIYQQNPCEFYNQGSGSRPNKGRRKGCARAAGHLWMAGYRYGDSTSCPQINGAECFQFVNHTKSGRCYAKVTFYDGTRGYVLLYTCVQDWARVFAARARNHNTAFGYGVNPVAQGYP